MRHNPPSRRDGRKRGRVAEGPAGPSEGERARLERWVRRNGCRIGFRLHGAWLEGPGEPGRRLLDAEDLADLLAAARRWEALWQGRRSAWRAWRRGGARATEPRAGLGHLASGNPATPSETF